MATLQRPINLISQSEFPINSSSYHNFKDLALDCRASSQASASVAEHLEQASRVHDHDNSRFMSVYHQTHNLSSSRANGARADAANFDCRTAFMVPSPPPAPPLPAVSNTEVRHVTAHCLKETVPSNAASQSCPVRPSTSLSEWCASMVCYIWFAGYTPEPSSGIITPAARSPSALHAPLQSSPLARRHRKKDSLSSLSEYSNFSAHDLSQAVDAHICSNPDVTRHCEHTSKDGALSLDPWSLRHNPRPRFKSFVRDMLNTTQVSKSVIILALLYIHRLKSRHPGLHGQEGSEFRLFVTALMLANKFLDDHTYTNKTWSELSGIDLKDVTKMEVEFWLGLSMSIYVSDVDFRHWIRTLENLADRRRQAILCREQELSRRAAFKQQQRQQQQQQQQQQELQHHHYRRMVNRHHPQQSQTWSPESSYSDDLRSPQRPSAPSLPLLPSSPSSHLSVEHPGKLNHADLSTPFFFSVPDSVAEVPAFASNLPRSHLTLPSQESATYETGYNRPPSSSYADLAVGSKRPHSTLHTVQDPVVGLSPERPCKRMAGVDPRYVSERLPRASLSPLGSEHLRGSSRGVSSDRALGTSPISVQHFPRSVFEPLVSTPNTLLAPYVAHQGTVIHQHRHHPLAYWQLAAGHDRGILGVHLPAPISTSTEYFTPECGSRRSSINSPMVKLACSRSVATTTPYPTPNVCFDKNQMLYGSATSAAAPPMPAHFEPERRSAAPLMYVQPTSVPVEENTHSYLINHSLQASHAPFNNAEGSYVDPFSRFM